MATNAETSAPDEHGQPELDTQQDAAAAAAAVEAEEAAAFKEFAQLLDGKEPDASDAPDPDLESSSEDTHADAAATRDGEAQQSADGSVEDDLWSGLTEQQREALAALQRERARAEHAFHSNRHRLSAYHRKLNATEAELEEARRQLERIPQQAPNTTTPTQSAPSTAPTNTDGSPVDLKQFQEDFPEVFAAMRALQQQELEQIRTGFKQELEQIKSQFGEVSQPIQQMAEEREEVFRQSQLAALSSAHPDWQDLEKSQEFWGWLNNQTPGVRALAGSTAAEDNIMLLNYYKQQRVASNPRPATPQAPRRPRQATAAETLPRAGTSRPSAMPDSANEDAMWAYWAKQADQNRI